MSAYEQSPPDEGYSEDPLTIRTSQPMPQWMVSMSMPERTEYVMSIIAQLPTSQVAEIVRRLRPRLYINFFQHLPTEVLLHILGFLDPLSLINTARASREWMVLAIDWKLWEQLYILEGFRVNRLEVQQFEDALNADRSRLSTQDDDGHNNKRRATPQRILPSLHTENDFEMIDADMAEPSTSIFGGPIKREPSEIKRELSEIKVDPDTIMTSPPPPSRVAHFPTRSTKDRVTRHGSTKSSQSSTGSPLSSISSLVVLDRRGAEVKKKLNWQYLYAQRRRLESNWETEKYTNFQLPDPNYPEEAHDECIYTIQHSGKYLVSGSRDKTVRIWNLDTRRLVRLPLRAHSGSVLCLQFDADPEEDLIVSGSSDATVVLWKFSTGQVIQRLRKAHRESVLNVRFDKRVLITCSKDKTIKIFNRRPLHAGDPGYPIDMSQAPTFLNNYGFNPAPSAGLPVRPAYSMIGCLEGHGAAVNAVQIHGDEVVSASGDRCVKVWNWVDQTCIRTLIGHTKGIACVQYDGRRIVSGSSDNEVKVFDKESGLEVASLRAHSNLVRTVQAGFGDLPYSADEDTKNAKEIDSRFFEAMESGALSRTLTERGRPRNAGSSKPEDISAYGAKLPPGGGGGRFGRIVSGSYDETIIIWRRDKEGVWRAQHTLRQEEAAQAASRAANRASRNDRDVTSQAPQVPQASQPPPAPEASPEPEADAPTIPFAPSSDTFYRHLIDLALAHGPGALRHALRSHPQILRYDYLDTQIASAAPDVRSVMGTVVNAAREALQPNPPQPGHLPLLTQASGSNSQSATTHTQSTLPILPASATTLPTAPLTSYATATTSAPPIPAAASTPAPAPLVNSQPPLGLTPTIIAVQAANAQHGAAALHPNHAAHHHLTTNMARVFKLQFDARRIICCSQTNIIVGWDFANADEKIIEASRFFAPIE